MSQLQGPRLGRWLIRILVPEDEQEFILGDLEELYRERAQRTGIGPARRRYVADAIRSAVSRLRVLRRTRAIARRLSPGPLLDVIWIETKLSARVSRKHPALTMVLITALALGIPTSLIPIHIVNILDAPLDVPGGERVVGLRYWDPGTWRAVNPPASDYFRWRDELTGFEAIGATFTHVRNAFGEDGVPRPLRGSVTSASTFQVLRTPPLLGRPLLPEDERPGAPDVVVLGYDAWRSHMGEDPDVVGREIRFASGPFTVVGVMPEGFEFPWRDQFWIPLRQSAEGQSNPLPVQLVGRLAEGVSPAAAEAEFRSVARLETDGEHPRGAYRGEVVSYARASLDIPRGTSVEVAVLQFFALVMLVLVCGSVGLLVLARTMARLGEVSIRSALGASRTRIVGQLFVETTLLALVATGIGLLIAERLLLMWEPVLTSPLMDGPAWVDFGLNRRTVVAALVLGVLSAVFTGVFPGLRATRGDLRRGLSDAGAGASGIGFGRGSTILIASMVSLTLCCLALGALMVPGLFRDRTAGMGIEATHFFAAEIRIPRSAGPTEEVTSTEGSVPVQEILRRRLEDEPGVRGVAFGRSLPGMGHRRVRIEIEGEEGTAYEVLENAVYPGFFLGLGQEPVSGRDFGMADLEDARNPVVVNTSFVERVFGGRNAVGRRIRYRTPGDTVIEAGSAAEWYEIVGVVGRLGMNRFVPEQDAGLYRPVEATEGGSVWLAIHAGPDPTALTPRVRTILADIEPFAMLRNPAALAEVPSPNEFEHLLWTVLMGVGIVVAGLLGISGLYALVAFTVERRTREIGIRRALGAQAAAVVTTILRRAALQLGIGIVFGGTAGILMVREFSGRVWLPPPNWPTILAALTGGVILMGLLACMSPTLRGLGISPSEALRASE